MLTTAQAARRLGVKPETIYAYVSRGLLTRTKVNRVSLFAVDEVEALADKARGGITGTTERIRTKLTLLEGDELYYRGRRATDLTAYPVESVAHFLWTGELKDAAFEPIELPDLPDAGTLTDRIRIAVAVAGAHDPLRFDLSPENYVRAAERLIATIVAALPLRQEPAGTSLAARLWVRMSAEPVQEQLLNSALVLLADHDLAVSTLAARVAASARAHLYAVVSAGLGVMEGPYHGMMPTLAYRFLTSAEPDPIAALGERLRSGQGVPGFGHGIYQRKDPRAEFLLAQLRKHGPLPADDIIRAVGHTFPNTDLALAAMAKRFGMPPEAGEVIFSVARVIGWVAHALEEYAEPGLRFRAVGVYTGERP
ncbi:citrate synthase [Lentzea sp. NBRC 105346]|nr:citrate synthase [Lentzea sp. NBRC 105346]